MTDININNTPDEPDEPEMAVCLFCSEEHEVSEMHTWLLSGNRYNNHGETLLCDSCNYEAFHCPHCGNLADGQDDTTYVDQSDETVCSSCLDEVDYCDRHGSHYERDGCERCDEGGDLIESYSYRPIPNFFKFDEDNKLPKELRTFTGFELEMEASGCERFDGAELATEIFSRYCYLKEDGSLNNGFEMVSHPLSHKFSVNQFPWERLKELADIGMRSANTRTCGLHIHINRNFFGGSPSTMYRFMSMFYRNSAQWKILAGRENSSYASWSEYELDRMLHYAKNFTQNAHNNERYVAINLQNRNTLELRFFKGTLRPETFIGRLEGVHAVAHYAYATRNRVNIKASHDWERFREWTITNKYTKFDAYASGKGV
jgi:hypothetical protein